MTDLIIIGAGPAGMTAAIYAARAGLDVILFEEKICGGQVAETNEIENYPGLNHVQGWQLASEMSDHVSKLGVDIIYKEITGIKDNGNVKYVLTNDKQYECKAIIISNGAKRRKINCPGENELQGKGVSYCAVCDGAFFRNKTVAVIGGGNTALEDAAYLSKICSKVYLIHRRNEFRGEKHLQNAVNGKENIEFLFSKTVKSINGTSCVESITLLENSDQSEITVKTDAVFIAIGLEPDNSKFSDVIELDENGYIKTDENCLSSVNGIFAAGDTRTKKLRQIITACSDGAIATNQAAEYISRFQL